MQHASKQLILVVDDDEGIRRALAAILEDGDYLTQTARNGREALEYAERDRPDLVITDLIMPSVDGWEVVVQLRERGVHVPVIMISGHAQRATNPSVRFLPKPIDGDRLLEMVDELLQTGPEAD